MAGNTLFITVLQYDQSNIYLETISIKLVSIQKFLMQVAIFYSL